MTKGYTKTQVAEALEALLDKVQDRLSEAERTEIFATHPCLEEVYECGAYGIVGLGLGVIGGHCIGEE